MFFAAPIWLFGLIPWGAVAVVLLMSRRRRTDVPFLELWTLNAPQESIRRSFSTPPIGVILMLLGILLGLLAAAGPSIRAGGIARVTVVVDAGASMSRGSAVDRQTPRYVEAAERLRVLLASTAVDGLSVDVVVVSGPERSPAESRRVAAGDLTDTLKAQPPSALDVGADVRRVVRQRLADPAARVALLSDNLPALEPDQLQRVLQVSPEARAADNAAITHLAVRRTPQPQAMVRLSRTGGASPGTAPAPLAVRLTSAGRTTSTPVALAVGQSLDVFVDLPAAGDLLTSELVRSPNDAGANESTWTDGFGGDDRADVIAEAAWPVIEPNLSVIELQRLVDLYAKARPPGDRSVRLRLVASAAELGSSAGLVMPAAVGMSTPVRVQRIADHPAVSPTALANLSVPASAARTLPPGDWKVILQDDAGPLLAVLDRQDPMASNAVRQAWTAIDPRGWAQQASYVVFWSMLFDWLGAAEAGERFTSHPIQTLTDDWRPVELAPGARGARWWPGVYERADGARRAFGPVLSVVSQPTGGSPPPTSGTPQAAPAGQDPVQWLRDGQAVTPLGPGFLVAAAACVLAAALVWRARPRSDTGLALPGLGR